MDHFIIQRRPQPCTPCSAEPQYVVCAPASYASTIQTLTLPSVPQPTLVLPEPPIPTLPGTTAHTTTFRFTPTVENGKLIISIPVENDVGVGFRNSGSLDLQIRSIHTITTKDGKFNKYTIELNREELDKLLTREPVPSTLPLSVTVGGKDFEIQNVFKRANAPLPRAVEPGPIPLMEQPQPPPESSSPQTSSVTKPPPVASSPSDAPPTETPPPIQTTTAGALITNRKMVSNLDFVERRAMLLTADKQEKSCGQVILDSAGEYKVMRFDLSSEDGRPQLNVVTMQETRETGSAALFVVSRDAEGQWRLQKGFSVTLPDTSTKALTPEEINACSKPGNQLAGTRNLAQWLDESVTRIQADETALQLGAIDRTKLERFTSQKVE